MSKQTLIDEDTYAEMEVPFDTPEEANTALQEFWAAVYELRKKHQLANVSLIVKDSIRGSGIFMWDGHCGSEVDVEPMAAWHFGRASAERQEMIRRATAEGAASSIKPAPRVVQRELLT